MKKKIAIITNNIDLSSDGSTVLRGSYYYISNFMLSLANGNDIDIYCNKQIKHDFSFANNIFYIKDGETVSEELLEERNYDFVWNMTGRIIRNKKFISFELKHSHSIIYRKRYVRSRLENFIKKIFNPSRYFSEEQLKHYKNSYTTNDIIFVNSKIAKFDYVEVMGQNEDNVYIINPMVIIKDKEPVKKETNVFTFGLSATTFSLKGGFIFLMALGYIKLMGQKKFRAKIIYPNFYKNLFVKIVISVLGIKKYIDFLTYQSDMNDFYNSINCLVMPSKEETFGLTGIEAMSNKLPVIVSNVSGIADIIQDGQNGYIFDIKKHPIKNLAKKLTDVMTSKQYDKICENAYNTAKENSLEKHSEKLNKILDEILLKRNKQ